MTEQWFPPVDLDNCDREPIHVPGAIQPHGVLLAVTEPDLVVAVVSRNSDDWLGAPSRDVIGRPLADVVGPDAAAAIDVARGLDWQQRLDDLLIDVRDVPCAATLHRSGRYLVVEIELARDDSARVATVVRDAAMSLQASRTVTEVAGRAAHWVRRLSDFDRVMVYRFDDEWNGEVIAEDKRDDLNTFLGLHYPASDIPAQARELYRRNWLRVIPDILYAPVPLDPPVAFGDEAPLDLSSSTLRSVSPMHVEYLSNMGVGASMSVSIVINGELWGLVACHHYSGAHHVSVAARNAAEYLAQLISLRIAETVEADVRAAAIELAGIAERVSVNLVALDAPTVATTLREHAADILKLADATGALIRAGELDVRIGDVPPDDIVEQILRAWPVSESYLRVNRLGLAADDAPSGALAFPLTSDHREFAMWFRPEIIEVVDWGGDPHNAKLAEVEGDNVRLSPRKSFELWRETVRGKAEPWTDAQARAALRLTRQIGSVLLRAERDATVLARDLQTIMRPEQLPVVDGFRLSVFSQSAGRGEIGGDWYDVFEVAAGRLAVIIGDVTGHGLAAASEMAQLRNVLRAYLLEVPDPATALERLSVFMLRLLPGSTATAVCGIVDTAGGTITVSHAGHVPALITADGGAEFVPILGDPLLGLRPCQRRNHVVTLSPGSAIVLYSDGLVETRRTRLDDGMARLRTAVTDLDGEASEPDAAARIVQSLTSGEPEDDVTVLVISRR